MLLKKYKYIRNLKPKFHDAVRADGNNYDYWNNNQSGSLVMNQGFKPTNYSYAAETLPNTDKIRTPMTQSEKPQNFGTQPVDKNGVVDYAPNVGGKADPSSAGGAGISSNLGGYYGQAAMSTIQAGFAINNAFNQPVKSSNDILNTAGQSTGLINGVGYNRQNSIDAAQEIEDEKAAANKEMLTLGLAVGGAGMATGLGIGATIGGSTAGPIGAGVGAVVGTLGGLLFGGAAKRKALRKLRLRIANAQQKVGRINLYNRSQAQSQALQQDYAREYGNPQSDVLYANKGKDTKPMYNSGKSGKVWGPSGYLNGQHNSWVGKGESLLNFNEGKGTLVTSGKVGVDNQPSSVQENDDNIILGNDVDWRVGTTFAKQGAPHTAKLQYINELEKKVGKYGNRSSLSEQTAQVFNRQMSSVKQETLDNLKLIADRQAEQHDIENKMKQGYVPQYDGGKSKWLENLGIALPSVLGIGEAALRASDANKQRIEGSNTYFTNPYASRGLQGLASLRYDINPELRAYNDKMRQSKYAMEQSGGLTAGLKYIARTAMYNDYIKGLASLYANANNINNQYRQQYYDALIKQGESDRNYLTQARRYDDDVYAKSHAARLAMRNQALKDMMENIYRADKRLYDNKVWRDTNALYQQQQRDRSLDRQAQLDIARETLNSNREIAEMQSRPQQNMFNQYSPYVVDWNYSNLLKNYRHNGIQI